MKITKEQKEIAKKGLKSIVKKNAIRFLLANPLTWFLIFIFVICCCLFVLLFLILDQTIGGVSLTNMVEYATDADCIDAAFGGLELDSADELAKCSSNVAKNQIVNSGRTDIEIVN